MTKAQKPKSPPPVAPKKRPLNLTVDGPLADIFDIYCERNRKAGSISNEVQEMMIKKIKYYGHRYGLKLPNHLA